MARPAVLLIALLLLPACKAAEEAPQASAVRPTTPRQTQVPLPPPLPTDPEGNGPAPVPKLIAAVLGDGTDVRVVLYRLDESARAGSASFHGHAIAESLELPRALAAEAAAVLGSPRSYTENHVLCTDEGIGVRLERAGARADFLVGVVCRHVHDAESGEEIGFLSTSGQEFVVRLARRVHVRIE